LVRIRELRKKNKLSAEELAEKLNISVPYLYNLEKGKRRLYDEMIEKLCSIFHVTADEVLGRDDKPSPDLEAPFREKNHANALIRISELAYEFDLPADMVVMLIKKVRKKYGYPEGKAAYSSNYPQSVSFAKKKLKKQLSQNKTLKTDIDKITEQKEEYSPLWYLDEIKKGQSFYDPDFLCRLLSENIIKPTIYGDPLTQDQKEGLIKFIRSHKGLLSDIKKDDSTQPENYGVHYEGEKSLDLNREPELVTLMKAADIISKMLQKYLEEEEASYK